MINVLVIGEICEDVFIYCESERLCPEVPVPVVLPKEIKKNSGMAGNVSNNLRSLSNQINVVEWVQPETITKTRYIDGKSNHMFLRVDDGESSITKFDDSKKKEIQNFDIVIVSDYNKGFLSPVDLEDIGKLSKLSILDSKKKLCPAVINSFDFIKLNENEAKHNYFLDSDKILITLGSRGCSYRGKIYPSMNPQQTIDVSGAGDTFTASFILKYYETGDIDNSIEFANEMSAIVVSKRGVATP